MSKKWQSLWYNGSLVSMVGGEYNLQTKAAIAVNDGKIVWQGTYDELAQSVDELAEQTHDLAGAILTPALIDCHTHMVFAGNRANEFAQRLAGKSYVEIAKAGGGIHYTVEQTRQASFDELLVLAKQRLQYWLANGVASIEIKSGYGLDLATEQKMLEVIAELKQSSPMNIQATYLGAHTVPKAFADNADAYVEQICNEHLPTLHDLNLIDAVDVFCESIGFNQQQTARIFQAAHDLGLPVKCHAEQLSHSGGVQVACQYNALSVEHLEYITEQDVQQMKQSNTVAVILPGAYYYLNEDNKPPVGLLFEQRVPVAIATDFNPGSSPLMSLLLAMNMACVQFGLTPEQALAGTTTHAARALGMLHKGTLEIGQDADFAIYQCQHPDELSYYVGHNPLTQLVINGQVIDRSQYV